MEIKSSYAEFYGIVKNIIKGENLITKVELQNLIKLTVVEEVKKYVGSEEFRDFLRDKLFDKCLSKEIVSSRNIEKDVASSLAERLRITYE